VSNNLKPNHGKPDPDAPSKPRKEEDWDSDSDMDSNDSDEDSDDSEDKKKDKKKSKKLNPKNATLQASKKLIYEQKNKDFFGDL